MSPKAKSRVQCPYHLNYVATLGLGLPYRPRACSLQPSPEALGPKSSDFEPHALAYLRRLVRSVMHVQSQKMFAAQFTLILSTPENLNHRSPLRQLSPGRCKALLASPAGLPLGSVSIFDSSDSRILDVASPRPQPHQAPTSFHNPGIGTPSLLTLTISRQHPTFFRAIGLFGNGPAPDGGDTRLLHLEDCWSQRSSSSADPMSVNPPS